MFCHLVVLVGLSVSVQVINWKDSSLEMTYNVLMGTLNSTHSLWIHYSDEYDEALQFIIAHYSAPKRIFGHSNSSSVAMVTTSITTDNCCDIGYLLLRDGTRQNAERGGSAGRHAIGQI